MHFFFAVKLMNMELRQHIIIHLCADSHIPYAKNLLAQDMVSKVTEQGKGNNIDFDLVYKYCYPSVSNHSNLSGF